jgi:hypothetical protein
LVKSRGGERKGVRARREEVAGARGEKMFDSLLNSKFYNKWYRKISPSF